MTASDHSAEYCAHRPEPAQDVQAAMTLRTDSQSRERLESVVTFRFRCSSYAFPSLASCVWRRGAMPRNAVPESTRHSVVPGLGSLAIGAVRLPGFQREAVVWAKRRNAPKSAVGRSSAVDSTVTSGQAWDFTDSLSPVPAEGRFVAAAPCLRPSNSAFLRINASGRMTSFPLLSISARASLRNAQSPSQWLPT